MTSGVKRQVKRAQANWLAWLALGLLVGSILACSAPPLVLPFKPWLTMIVGPDPQVSVSTTDRDAAYRIVEKRLGYAFGSGDVRTIRRDGLLVIKIRDAADGESAGRLAIAPGLLMLVDSVRPLAEGGSVPEDGKAVIQGNFTEKSAMLLSVQITNGALPVPLVVIENK
jgi:hypothetical protein